MKKLLIAATVIVVLAGCSKPAPHPEIPAIPTRDGLTEVQHKLSDGRTVTCLLSDRDAGYDLGMSCDWANAK